MKTLWKILILILAPSLILTGCRADYRVGKLPVSPRAVFTKPVATTKVETTGDCKSESLELKTGFVELCPIEGWQITVEQNNLRIAPKPPSAEIQLNLISTNDFTFVQLKPPMGESFKNTRKWKERGIYFETIEDGLGPSLYGPATIRHYLYPLTYSSIEIDFHESPVPELTKQGLEIIESMRFKEKHPLE